MKKLLDRNTVIGAVLGISLVFSGMAAASNTNSHWLSNLFSSKSDDGYFVIKADNQLLADQDFLVYNEITHQVVNCSEGKAGSVGASMKTAMEVHMKIASATPKVEQLFDVSGSCFASIAQIFDLSFSIPSLQAIIAAAQQAVLQYAQKKICTAINQVTGMVTAPINKVINDINTTVAGFEDINGMAGSKMGDMLSSIDPNLGNEYHPPAPGGTISLNTNPFNQQQTNFDPNGSEASNNATKNMNDVNAILAQISSANERLGQDLTALAVASSAYDSCAAAGNGAGVGCGGQLAALQNAQDRVNADNATIADLQAKLLKIGTQPTDPPAPVIGQTPNSFVSGQQAQPAQAQPRPQSGGWLNGLSNLFN